MDTMVEGTGLFYDEADAVVLDYWLGGDSETKEEWAKRVWDKCHEWQSTGGKGHDGKGMETVYARSPFELWEEKKRRRRIRFAQEMNKEPPVDDDEDFLKAETIVEDIRRKKKPRYPSKYANPTILDLAKKPHYTTRTQHDKEVWDERKKAHEKVWGDREKRVDFYKKQGRTTEEILLTHPELVNVVKMREKGPAIRERRGKK